LFSLFFEKSEKKWYKIGASEKRIFFSKVLRSQSAKQKNLRGKKINKIIFKER